jgi:hypothetical protein
MPVTPRIAGLALAVLVAAAGCGKRPTDPSLPIAKLRGVVHVIPTGPNIGGVTVTVQGRSTITAADGSFTLTGLTPGETDVSLTRDGFHRGALRVTLVAGDNFFSLGMSAGP